MTLSGAWKKAADAARLAGGLVIQSPMILTFLAYGFVRAAGGQAEYWKDKWDQKNLPLKNFDPWAETPEPPYWQDIVFSESRMEKLLERLEGIPPVDDVIRNASLQYSECGLCLPGQEKLVVYGLNDKKIRDVVGILAGVQASASGGGRAMRLDFCCGLIDAADESIIYDRQALVSTVEHAITPEWQWRHNQGYRNKYVPDIAGAVLTWLVHDVAPAVPGIFYRLSMKPEQDGSLSVTQLPQDTRGSWYDGMKAGYSGSQDGYVHHGGPAMCETTEALLKNSL